MNISGQGRLRLPIQEMWQQLDAGYHNEGWKSNAIKRPKDKKETEHKASSDGRSFLSIVSVCVKIRWGCRAHIFADNTFYDNKTP